MKIEKLVITGSKGVIGSILARALSGEFQVTAVDLPELDLRDFSVVESFNWSGSGYSFGLE